jgi:hypothetical protein
MEALMIGFVPAVTSKNEHRKQSTTPPAVCQPSLREQIALHAIRFET